MVFPNYSPIYMHSIEHLIIVGRLKLEMRNVCLVVFFDFIEKIYFTLHSYLHLSL
ncbi:hypothetical protein MCHI_000269 [Candidatus Magnetoovum chiemensis]|nr:hypothetical protein MCHI_000269 [Candidatus Magnetoovum chiemensis]